MSRAERAPGTDWKVWQDAEVATQFLQERRSAILGARDQLTVLTQLLPLRPANPESAWILDMGCGDGILLETVLRCWPGACGVALDGSPTMLQHAENRLSALFPGAVAFVQADFSVPEWRAALPHDRYDVIVSGFAIHHSEDPIKRRIYADIFDLLAPGGAFIHCEHVASASSRGEQLFEYAYALNCWKQEQERGETISFEESLSQLLNRLDKSANRLTSVETQLEWLREIGYEDVDCYWKYYELAIFAGYKSEI
jgi:trans-aconitate methyltransferase